MNRDIRSYVLWLVASTLLFAILFHNLKAVDSLWMASIAYFTVTGMLIYVIHRLHRRKIERIRNELGQILKTLEAFDLDAPGHASFVKSRIYVLNEINEYLQELITRIRSDFQANKQFTQNASHELQTPLAVIKGHVELLFQSPTLGEKEMRSLNTVLENTNRLSKLNTALILLSKIEHRHYTDVKEIEFSKLVDRTLKYFQDQMKVRALDVTKDYPTEFVHSMSETLAEILMTNIIQNAVRHNVLDGFIHVKCSGNFIEVINSGNPLTVDSEKMFGRFVRQSRVEDSLGLGLSIVKRICEQSGLNISYSNEDSTHRIRLSVAVI